MLLADKICIVTGAASKRGIGRAVANLFAEHGGKVVILDLDGDAARLAAAGLRGRGHKGYPCDVTSHAQCVASVAAALDDFGAVHVLVNNAGVAQARDLMTITTADYDAVLDVNLRGTLNMCQAVVPHMRREKRGSIVNLASVAAQRGGGVFGGPHYCASKGGVLGLTKAMARELGPDHVRVNAICPSLIDTDIVGDLLHTERGAAFLATIPMGRAGRPDEVAGCALFLASDLASYVTGSEVDVNGGSHIH
jgi:NAD(P)-dependent dehydrogenase (short-subunit alcohol dehydrogenase family)